VSKKNLFLIVIIVLVSQIAALATLSAATIERTVDFARPKISYDGQATAIMVENLPVSANPGEPLLPVYGLRVLLPQGESVVGIQAVAATEEAIPVDFADALARLELPTDRPSKGSASEVSAAAAVEPVFDPDRAFPTERARLVYTGTYRGFNVAFISVYPVTYVGAGETLIYAPRVTVTIETRPSQTMLHRSFGTLRESNAEDLATVAALVGDAEARASYLAAGGVMVGAGLADSAETFPYVIITSSALEPEFEPLREHRTDRGLRAKIVLVSDIAAAYSGGDLQAKIREFIKDAYLNWETEYVLLAGDDDIIPHRGLYAVGPSAVDADIASDLYYAGLDGNWNDDGDGYWGEPAEADLMPEVSVGRAAVGDSLEAANFVNKVIRYEDSPVAQQTETALMVGEALSAGTWGGDYKDEIRYGAATHGYATTGVPANFTVGTLYDRDLQPAQWTKADLIPLLNSGRHIVNHLGHSDVTYGLRMYNADVETSFTNDGTTSTYFIIYSQGCYSGSFDNKSPSGYTEDCIGEHFTSIPNGAVAFVGNTRYGWYMPYSTNGSSQHYDRQFFDALSGESISALGKIQDDSKVDNIPLVDVAAMRWVYYSLVLLGDPAMDVWTDSPESLVVTHPDLVLVSDNQVEVAVAGGGAPVEGARVSIFTDSTYSTALTDAAGLAYLDPKAPDAGEVSIAVTARNFYAYIDSVAVVVSAPALLAVSDLTVDDDSLGASSGDSDSTVEAGETIESVISLANVGQDSAFAISAVLRTADSFVSLIDSAGLYGDIAPDSVSVPAWDYVFEVSPATPDRHTVEFDLEITSADSTLVRRAWVEVSAPELEVAGVSTGDSLYGNGDGCLGPGEGFALRLEVGNRGSGDAYGTSLIVSEDDAYVMLVSDSAYVDTVPAGGSVEISPAFVLTISPECPEFHRIDLVLTATCASGRVAADTLAIYVGGSLAEDVEGGSPGWAHRDFDDTRVDQWHIDGYRNHSSGGSGAWKFGGSGAANYANFSHGALETPELCLGPGATLSFWHWIRAELNYGKYAWDGGIVEISIDRGETWSQISPVGGYDYKIYGNFFSPFAGETPCFAWTADWTRVEFDLSAYEGSAKIRFRFGSDQYYAAEGWYIDDLVVSDDRSSVAIPGGDLIPVPATFALAAPSPNPVASRLDVVFDVPRSSRVAVRIFDVAGREVATVADGVFEPGRHVRDFDAGAALAPGVYFLSMRSDSFSATRKLILAR
jgi:hypothetical protein